MRYIHGNNKVLRFGWVIVDDSIRGKGYGTSMLRTGLYYAFNILGVHTVTIGVFEHNDIAHSCYKKVGFVTLEDQIDLERKGQQSFQGVVYARLIAFGNGGHHALYDKTDGFYRRQLILTTKDKVDGREDDPYLIDKLRKERDGIFLWALE